jgi:hypothetical protein
VHYRPGNVALVIYAIGLFAFIGGAAGLVVLFMLGDIRLGRTVK